MNAKLTIGECTVPETNVSVYEALYQRRMAWSFKDEAVPREVLDRLLETARASFDQAEQVALWQEAELYLMENAVAVPLVVEFLPWLTNPDRIGGELFLLLGGGPTSCRPTS